MTLIQCDNLTLGYDTGAVAEGLSFSVEEGDYLCILGENGSGKTTLMKTLLGLVPPLGGTLEFSGAARVGIGYLPQQTAVQKDFPASVREVVLSGCQGRCGRRPFYSREDKRLAAECMERLGVTDLAGKCYRELSGGQQQRVLLARALCAAQRILLLDEPVTGLDPMAAAEMYRVIDELHRSGVTIVMISHDVAAALQGADHVLHIGDSIFFGTREEYVRSSAAQSFLGVEGGDSA